MSSAPGKEMEKELRATPDSAPKNMEEIRVLIKTKNFESIFHERIKLHGDVALRVICEGAEGEMLAKGQAWELQKDAPPFSRDVRRIRIVPEKSEGRIFLEGLERNRADEGYRGLMEVQAWPEGLVVINQLNLEEYLLSVVPSEMPATYPHEALKAQAVCARTYAYGRMLQPGYPEFDAHLDDSTAFQVYHNVGESPSATNAVEDTKGMVLWTTNGRLAETYYYSTSCGRGTGPEAWTAEMPEAKDSYLRGRRITKSEMDKRSGDGMDAFLNRAEADFLLGEDPDDYEQGEAWYRWSYSVENLNVEAFSERLRRLLGEEALLDAINDVTVLERGTGGIAIKLLVCSGEKEYVIRGERNVRELLCDGHSMAVLKDGKSYLCETLVPSAFFLLTTSKIGENVVGYTLKGGGFGHGIGMSQNGAKRMAEEGRSAEEILGFFYGDCQLSRID